MKKLTFELEFITPAFIGGEGPEQSAELRPASFVGLLRWWWRALKGLNDTKELYKQECDIFGGGWRIRGKICLICKKIALHDSS